jgi:hypothetical protein
MGSSSGWLGVGERTSAAEAAWLGRRLWHGLGRAVEQNITRHRITKSATVYAVFSLQSCAVAGGETHPSISSDKLES